VTRAVVRGQTPERVVKRNAILLILSIGLTVLALRIALHNSPDSDFDVAGYNIHHLFTGLVLIALGGIPFRWRYSAARRERWTPRSWCSARDWEWRSTSGFI
jgi:hypothetical protein